MPELCPPWPAPTASSALYTASCHCGAIAFTCTLSPPLYPPTTTTSPTNSSHFPLTRCNCSICSLNGYLFVQPFTRDVTWAPDALQHRREYRMATKTCPHWFCDVCGSSLGCDLGPLGDLDGEGMGTRCAVNVRMFKGVDWDRVVYKDVDGKNGLHPELNPKE